MLILVADHPLRDDLVSSCNLFLLIAGERHAYSDVVRYGLLSFSQARLWAFNFSGGQLWNNSCSVNGYIKSAVDPAALGKTKPSKEQVRHNETNPPPVGGGDDSAAIYRARRPNMALPNR